MRITTLLKVLTFVSISNTACSQKPSPCPTILIYEPRNLENDRWYAVVNLITKESLRGLWLTITLDRHADLLGNIFGDATTSNNRDFLIKSNNYVLEAGTVTPVRFFVKYKGGGVVPSVKEINLNGRTICSAVGSSTSRPTLSERPQRPSNTQREESSFRPAIEEAETSKPTKFITTRYKPSSLSNTQEESRSNRPAESSFNPSSLRPSSSFEEIRPNRPNTFTRPSSVDDLEAPSPNTDYRPSTFYEDSNNYSRPDRVDQERTSSLSTEQDNDDFFTGDFSAIVNKPPSNPSTRPKVQRNQMCGVVASQPRPLISYGQETQPGQWPWHAALYHSKGIQLMYTCGGTLISPSHIVTAAHCVTKPRTNRPINPQNILAYLGKHNLRKFGSEIQDREVSDIYVHPQYNHSGYYNDIAVLRLGEPVEITNYVRPVCLWEEDTRLNEIEGKLGTVVGWGFNENGVLTTTLMQAQMPIVSLTECIFSNRDFFSQFTSEKSFCAGFRNGTSVCNGDSGGGMVFPKKGTGGTVWQIRGLVSVGVAFQGKILCDTSQYVVFTDVAKHLDWIRTILNDYS